MVKLSKIFSYRTNSPMIMKVYMEQYILKLYKVYINNDPELTLTYFKTMSKLVKLVFVLTVGPERLQDHWSSGFKITPDNLLIVLYQLLKVPSL